MRNIIYLFFVFMGVFVQKTSFAQCSTAVDSTQINYENNLTDTFTELTTLGRNFQVHVYITNNNNGQTDFYASTINNGLIEFNSAIESIGVNLKLSDSTHIKNYQLNNVRLGRNNENIEAQYTQQNVINIYVVGFLFDEANQQTCAFTHYPSVQKNVIYLKKDCYSNALLIEQLGHFFNLYHTHETTFGSELAKQTNCTKTGDRCCDTPADPNLGKVDINNCQYVDSQKDTEGNFYVPTTANYMSASNDDCKCTFSDNQLLRMLNCMVGSRAYLW